MLTDKLPNPFQKVAKLVNGKLQWQEDQDANGNSLDNQLISQAETINHPLYRHSVYPTIKSDEFKITSGIFNIPSSEKWVIWWTEWGTSGSYETSVVKVADSYDKGQTIQNVRTIRDETASNIGNYSGAYGMMNGRLGMLFCRYDGDTSSYLPPVFVYSDDNGSSWSSTVLSGLSNGIQPYFDIIPYPTSVGGDDDNGFIALANQQPSLDSINYLYTTDNGANWSEGKAIANSQLPDSTNDQVGEANFARIGSEDKWIMVVRRQDATGLNAYISKSTDLTTWDDPIDSGQAVGQNPHYLTTFGDKFYWVLANRSWKSSGLDETKGALVYQTANEDDIWNDLTAWTGWKYLAEMPGKEAHGYLTLRQDEGEWYGTFQADEDPDHNKGQIFTIGTQSRRNDSYKTISGDTTFTIGSSGDFSDFHSAKDYLEGTIIQGTQVTLELQENQTLNEIVRWQGILTTGFDARLFIDLNGNDLTVNNTDGGFYFAGMYGALFDTDGSGSIKAGGDGINYLARWDVNAFGLTGCDFDIDGHTIESSLQCSNGTTLFLYIGTSFSDTAGGGSYNKGAVLGSAGDIKLEINYSAVPSWQVSKGSIVVDRSNGNIYSGDPVHRQRELALPLPLNSHYSTTSTSWETIIDSVRIVDFDEISQVRLLARLDNSNAGDTTSIISRIDFTQVASTEISNTGSWAYIDSGWIDVDKSGILAIDLQIKVSGGTGKMNSGTQIIAR